MNVLVSECSSGCESGWTMYLEHSMDDASHRDPPPFVEANNKRVADEGEVGDEEEEDLSMVSDASSGPPHLHEEEEEEQDQYHEGCLDNNGGRLNKLEYPVSETGRGSVPLKCKSSSKRKKKMGDHHPSFLDDTASSPLINFNPSVSSSAFPLMPLSFSFASHTLTLIKNDVLKLN